MNVARLDTFRKPFAQTSDVAALQFLFYFAHLFLGRDKLARLSRVLIHHHIQGELHVALNTVREIADFIAALRRELKFLHLQTPGEVQHDPCDGIGCGIQAV